MRLLYYAINITLSLAFAIQVLAQDSLDLYLLKNDHQIIPLQGLQHTFIGTKTYSYDETFEMALNRYTTLFSLKQEKFVPDLHGTWFEKDLTDSVYVYGIDLVRSPRGLQTFLNQIPDSLTTVLCFWGSLEKLRNLRIPNHANAVLYTPEYSSYYISALGQAVFGGRAVTKKIAEAINDSIPAQSGFLTEKIRLGYGELSEVGMNDTLVRDSIRSIGLNAIQDSVFPGMQVLIAKNGLVVYHEAFGYHTYDKLREVRLSDIYDFASVTKITAGLPGLMKMHGEGMFDLEKPLDHYVPEMAGSNKGNIPMRQILAHNARIQSWIAYWTTAKKKNGKWKGRTIKPDSTKKYNVWLTDEMWLHYKYKQRIYKMIKKSPLYDEPGYVYSGLLFYLIPKIIETQNGHHSFEHYLKDAFYHPIGSFSLTHNPYKYFPLERIIPTERDTFFRMKQLHGVVHDEGAAMMGGISSNAGLFGTANDLAKLAQMYCNYGSYGGTRFIEESTFKEFASCQYCEEGNRRGLGFERPLIEYDPEASHVSSLVSNESFGHSGYTGTFVWIDPKYDLIYIFFSNRVYPTRLNRKLYTQNIRPRIQDVIYRSFLNPQH